MKIYSDARPLVTKVLAMSIILLFSVLAFSPLVKSDQNIQENTILLENGGAQQELDLLRGEHYLFVTASEDVSSFHLRYVFPPDYQYQVPILFEILEDSTAEILHYEIESDISEPNKVVDFTMGPMQKGEIASIHMYFWVLVKNHDYSDLPQYIRMPKPCDIPDEPKQWLEPSVVVQSNNLLIKMKARQLLGHTTNLFTYASRVVHFGKYHHLLYYTWQLVLGTLRGQDALTTLFRNGDCPGRSHLNCALFRAQDVPARVVMATPHYDFWFQMHFMTEVYCPGQGWILAEVHNAVIPYEPKNQIIMRICSSEDEASTGQDYFFPKMTGVERWLWIDNSHVTPYYVDLKEGSRINMFPEHEIMTDHVSAEYAFSLTEMVLQYYEQYLGANLSAENQLHFNNAVSYQKQAILAFKQSQETDGYLGFMNQAYEEYNEIHI